MELVWTPTSVQSKTLSQMSTTLVESFNGPYVVGRKSDNTFVLLWGCKYGSISSEKYTHAAILTAEGVVTNSNRSASSNYSMAQALKSRYGCNAMYDGTVQAELLAGTWDQEHLQELFTALEDGLGEFIAI